MQIQIRSKDLSLTDAQKEYIQSKVDKLATYAERIRDESSEIRVEIERSKSKNLDEKYVCQITMFVPGAVLRAETKETTVEAVADSAEQKLITQIERYKSKQSRRNKSGKWIPASTLEEVVEDDLPKIMRRKRYSDSTPMTEEEAIEQMELIGHNFFLFMNAETNRFSVVYKREDGHYGLIEPKEAGK